VSGDAALLARFNGSDYASHIALTPASSTSRMLGDQPIHPLEPDIPAQQTWHMINVRKTAFQFESRATRK
jgi:hypothetical protein